MNQTLKNYLTFKVNPFTYIPRRVVDKLRMRISPKAQAVYHYEQTTGRKMDFDNPKDMNQKILKCMFYSDTSQWPRLGDKYAMRGYLEEKGYGHLQVPLYGVWDNAKEIDFNKVPRPCVFKVNNANSTNIILEKGKEYDYQQIRKQLNKWMKQVYGRESGEWHYSKMKPKITAEALLDAKLQDFESDTLIDYKLFCFDGVPQLFHISYNRRGHGEFTMREVRGPKWEDWNYMYGEHSHYTIAGDGRAVAPKCLNEIIEAAKILSKGFPEIRVDFYVVDGKPYIGEFTFANCGCMEDGLNQEALNYWGTKIKI